MDNFRVFGPDENASHKLDNLYEVTQKTWRADIFKASSIMDFLSSHQR